MTERDAFELRFHAAVRGYIGRVSTDLDAAGLARRIAAAEPRRHGLAAALGSRGVAVPRAAWALLLLAGLLAALVGGVLIAGSLQVRRLPAVVPPVVPTSAPLPVPTATAASSATPAPTSRPAIAPAFACPPGSNPDQPGPVDQERPATPSTIAFDRHAGTLVALADAGSGLETWTFDVCTNTWTQMHPDQEPPTFEWGRLVYDVDSDAMILVTYPGDVWAYDHGDDTWRRMGAGPVRAMPVGHDPASGLVVVAADDLLWDYDVDTDTWTEIPQANGTGCGPGGAYDASVGRVIGYCGNETWTLDVRTGTWSRSGAETPSVTAGWGMGPAPDLVYDESAERTVVIGNGRMAAYDATADRWEIVAEMARFLPLPMAYDPVNRRLVGWGREGVVGEGGVAAFDLAKRQWTVLLEPGEEHPAPSST